MRVLLVSANREEINMRTWPLGLACVAVAAEQAGHNVKLLDLFSETEPRSALEQGIRQFQPQVIGISVRNIDDQSMKDTVFLLEEVKEVVSDCKAFSDAPIVLGGSGYSMFPEICLEYLNADMGIQGEGESAFLALLERLQEGSDLSDVPGLYLSGRGLQGNRTLVKNLDRYPLPAAGLLPPFLAADRDFWLPVQTRRGCAMNCSYCSTATIEGCLLRKRTPETVVQWLREWVSAGFRRFFFVDNTFNLPPSYASALCSEIIAAQMDVVWRCILYPVRIEGRLVAKMAQAGCREVSLGFESGSEIVLQGMNKRFKPQQVREVSNLLADHGISRMGFLLLGGPGETEETVLQSLEFADSLRLEAVKVSVGIRIYPHTALAERAVEDGIISPEDKLLFPRFYVSPKLDLDWLHEIVAQWSATRPNWLA
jgi:radical SAM superfamily enzyme YgiQ (UPF0313 family)